MAERCQLGLGRTDVLALASQFHSTVKYAHAQWRIRPLFRNNFANGYHFGIEHQNL